MVKLRYNVLVQKRPFYRIVAADSRYPRDGRFIEIIGTYNPITQPQEVKLMKKKLLKWLKNGAQPTNTVRSLFSRQGIMEKFHQHKLGK